ncbi:50S ribosomal protein L9 [Mycoplasmopsis anatis]|uniref:Large ribosomal subunit protein bL9 n=1 Tax=Mycoplasmopsis anatis TaxID=171279 RepID=A0A9Q3L8D5_9BACT|nr:50S ribosomal protein L9 [Mycoplasmopsis anatis]MBW0594588.1 50S ribosomal protein L9 [Mycoplasmopsis anatis]MBW0595358.1 50S ribosomal protein L9 [Mycoplasmopsis anatis]MBW0598093.1 50S ribosomal protein L9 [Mycoplasmopsis anatis]MBW0599000.1 50S ribosomal protein L9 [Mycoplasmopsis anatis]MBW0601181.1 50S ribosomal protein L9 [Mycoplasmopsis anatis]
MKVILIKDCKDGKANTVIEVSDGYAKNFLIRQGLALPFNEATKRTLERKLDQLSAKEHETRREALRVKEELENVRLVYELEANIDANFNLNVHGSISTKQIEKDLKNLGFKLDKHSLEKIHLVSNGTHEIKVKVYNDIIAKVYIEIKIKEVK